MRFVIEHLEPRLWKWCLLEYKHISEIVGKDKLIFTNIRPKDEEKLAGLGKVYAKSIKESRWSRICVLDPFAERTLSTSDSFHYLALGGILGDSPMQGRTETELSVPLGAEKRNLGPEQMSTDTAVYVAKHIIEGGSLDDLEFQDEIEIPTREDESVILPFRYVLIHGKPLLPKGMIEFLKERKGF